MADEPAVATAPPKAEDTPTPPEAPATPDTPESDSPKVPDGYIEESRYKELQAEFTRRNEQWADIEGRNGPERQAAALQEHARIELEDEEAEEPDDEFELPPDPSEEIAEIRQELAERDEAARAAEEDRLETRHCDETISDLEESENFKLTEKEYDFVVNRALANRDPHDGRPDLEGSFKAFKESIQERNNGYLQSKDTFVPPVGSEGEPKIDHRDKEQRQKLGTEIFEQHRRSQES